MELVALAYIEHEKMPYHIPTLPFPLLKHLVIVHKKELQPQVDFDEDGNAFVSQLSQETIDSIVTKREVWFRKWTIDKTNYDLALVEI